MIQTFRQHLFLLLAGLVAIFASVLSLFVGLKQSLWFDEAFSVALAEHSWIEIVRLTAVDVHPPLYYWLLKTWMVFFGSSELALRSLSVVLFGASVAAAAMLLRKLFGARTAALALPLIAFSPFLLRYGFEVRMYAFASLIGIVATYILVLALESKSSRLQIKLLAAYGLLVAAGVYTLYFMALLWMAHLAWLFLEARRQKQYIFFRRAVITYTGSFLLFLPWLPNVLRSAGGGSLSPVTHSIGAEQLMGMITYPFMYRPPWIVSIVYVCLLLALLAFVAVRGYKQAAQKERRFLGLLGAYFLVPIAILVVATQLLPVYLERYLAHFALGGYAFFGVLAAMMLRQKAILNYAAAAALGAVLVVGCLSLARYGNYNFQRLHTPSVKQVAASLSDCKNDAVIFADGPQVAMELMYYVKDCPVYFFNETHEMGGGFAMISHSPLRVASPNDLPGAEKMFHVYYDKPKNSIAAPYEKVGEQEFEAVRVATYQAKRVY